MYMCIGKTSYMNHVLGINILAHSRSVLWMPIKLYCSTTYSTCIMYNTCAWIDTITLKMPPHRLPPLGFTGFLPLKVASKAGLDFNLVRYSLSTG